MNKSSKVSSLCTQCSDRKYSFSSSATSWFRTPNFRRSKATDEDAGEAAYRRSNSFQRFDRTDLVYRRIAVHRRIDYQRIGVSDSNVQHNKLVHRRIGVHRRIDYHKSAYQIPTFNQQIGAPAKSAYTGESITINRRIRFQRSTQQIGTPANWRTQANRLPSFGVSDSNVQHNRLVYRRIGVPATGDRRVAVSDSNVQHNRLVHRRGGDRRPATGDRRSATGDRRPATGDRRPASRRINFQRKRRWNRSTHQLRSIDGDRLSTPRCQRPQPG